MQILVVVAAIRTRYCCVILGQPRVAGRLAVVGSTLAAMVWVDHASKTVVGEGFLVSGARPRVSRS